MAFYNLIYHTEEKALYGWGFNHYGQLGIGRHGDQKLPQKIPFFKDIEIDCIYCTPYHSFAFTSSGVLSWGRNDNGQLGLGRYGDEIFPTVLTFFDDKDILAFFPGEFYTFALTTEGLFGWGWNGHGQLGLGHNENVFSPQKIDFFDDQEMLTIYCSDNHCFALTFEGLFSWGPNENGQLGLGHNEDQNLPQKITFFDDKEILDIYCGGNHCFALTSEGLFGWGRNQYGQLGLGHNENQNSPQKIDFFDDKKMLTIYRSDNHCFALTSAGLFGWGCNQYGQLGLDHNKNQNSPQKIDFFDDKEIDSVHPVDRVCFVLTSEGLFSWGWNQYGQLGLGHNRNRFTPQKITFFDDKKILAIYFSSNYSLVITPEGLFSWGWNNYGQLGLGHYQDQNLPQKMTFFNHKDPKDLSLRRLKIFPIDRKLERSRKVLGQLLCFRKFSKESVFGEDFLPLDLFKHILRLSNLTRSQKINFKRKQQISKN